MTPGWKASALAKAVGGKLEGPDDVLILSAANISDAGPGDIVLAENRKYLATAARSAASAVIAGEAPCGDKPVITVANPRGAFVDILRILAPQAKQPVPGVDPGARVGERFHCGEGSSVGFGCWIGDDVIIGKGSAIYPLAYLGDGVRIGDGTVIDPQVTIWAGCEIGSGVTIHSGTVIGSDGFGYVQTGNSLVKVPQIGKVIVEDDVEIGANTAIDRAKTGATRIGRGTKIDNLVQIAHNVKMGESCVIIAQVGIAGSSELGNGVTIAGQAGVREHVRMGDGAIVAGQSGVYGDLDGGLTYSGTPARPHSETLRCQAALLRLPETQKALEKLEKEVERLRGMLAELGGDRVELDRE